MVGGVRGRGGVGVEEVGLKEEGARGEAAGSWVAVRALSWSMPALALEQDAIVVMVESDGVEDGVGSAVGGVERLLGDCLLGADAAEGVEEVGEGVNGGGGGVGVGGEFFYAEVDGAAGEDVSGGSVAGGWRRSRCRCGGGAGGRG